MTAQHTPGPWTIAVMGDEELHWFEVRGDADGEGWRNIIAAGVDNLNDARMIAAAPDLLGLANQYEAWEASVILDADWSCDTPRLAQAQWDELVRLQGLRNAAIAKAKGGAA